MPATLVITCNVEDRYRGYLASIMLELTSGIYLAPTLSRAVRERTWEVLKEWHQALQNGSIMMVWADAAESGGIGILTLGEPAREVVEVDGLRLIRRL